jgi:hypothetical protein
MVFERTIFLAHYNLEEPVPDGKDTNRTLVPGAPFDPPPDLTEVEVEEEDEDGALSRRSSDPTSGSAVLTAVLTVIAILLLLLLVVVAPASRQILENLEKANRMTTPLVVTTKATPISPTAAPAPVSQQSDRSDGQQVSEVNLRHSVVRSTGGANKK